jgi:hypothetical protein
MPLIFRLDITKQNCWKCKYFRRDTESGTPNEGSCTEESPTGSGGVPGTTAGHTQDEVHAHVAYPELTVCRKFEPFEGAARTQLGQLE